MVEPNIESLPDRLSAYENIELADLTTAIESADVVVLLVDHREFVGADQNLLDGKSVIDTRGVWR